ncbi:MAG TPA: hypothetical protein VFX54_16240, partial [Candidatus Binatia bacterium]|nr:hypothetical protein [Candidatus Binatia bacterium]
MNVPAEFLSGPLQTPPAVRELYWIVGYPRCFQKHTCVPPGLGACLNTLDARELYRFTGVQRR